MFVSVQMISLSLSLSLSCFSLSALTLSHQSPRLTATPHIFQSIETKPINQFKPAHATTNLHHKFYSPPTHHPQPHPAHLYHLHRSRSVREGKKKKKDERKEKKRQKTHPVPCPGRRTERQRGSCNTRRTALTMKEESCSSCLSREVLGSPGVETHVPVPPRGCFPPPPPPLPLP